MLLALLPPMVVYASGPSSSPREWEDWEIKTYPWGCELQRMHRALVAPFYPDVYIRFGVEIASRNASEQKGNSNVYGKLSLSLYSYLPNVPAANRPLHRIEKAVFAGKTMQVLNIPSDDMYRILQLQGEDAHVVMDTLRKAHRISGFVQLDLHLSDGNMVTKLVRPGSYFKTQVRMLSVCMADGYTH